MWAQLDAALARPLLKMCISEDCVAARIIRDPALYFFFFFLLALGKLRVRNPVCFRSGPWDFYLWYEKKSIVSKLATTYFHGCIGRGRGGFGKL